MGGSAGGGREGRDWKGWRLEIGPRGAEILEEEEQRGRKGGECASGLWAEGRRGKVVSELRGG